MHFRWNDNSCEIVFSKKERKLVKEKGILQTLSPDSMRWNY